jgi:hypothetical protein
MGVREAEGGHDSREDLESFLTLDAPETGADMSIPGPVV